MKIRYNSLSLGLIVLTFAVTAVMYTTLPDPFPTHFGLDGKADRFQPLPWGVLILPLATLGTWLVLRVLPHISPRGFRMDEFMDAYNAIVLAVVGFLCVMQVDLLWRTSQGLTTLGSWVPIGVGVILCVTGNFLNKTRPNFFMGIRTPWTLADPEVWSRTHRLAGWAFTAVGLTLIFTSLFSSIAIAVGATVTLSLVLAIILVVYSYVIYRKLDRQA